MKTICLLFIFAFFISCNSPNEPGEKLKWDSTPAAAIKTNDSIVDDDPESENDGEYLENLSCDDLENKKVIYDLIRENDSYGFIKYDTSNILVFHGHFISSDTLSTLIFIPGDAGEPCGTGCNMLLLYNCGERVTFVLTDRSGSFDGKDI